MRIFAPFRSLRVVILAMPLLAVPQAASAQDGLCEVIGSPGATPGRTGPIADVLYSAGGNSAGVYDGSDQAYLKLFVDTGGEVLARGIIRDEAADLLLIARGAAEAHCADRTLVRLSLQLEDPRTGDLFQALVIPTGVSDREGRLLATLEIVGRTVAWTYVVIRPAR